MMDIMISGEGYFLDVSVISTTSRAQLLYCGYSLSEMLQGQFPPSKIKKYLIDKAGRAYRQLPATSPFNLVQAQS